MIRLNLRTDDEVGAAFDLVMANANRVSPRPHINGVLVQPMVPQVTEIMVGGKVDPLFGPLICGGGRIIAVDALIVRR